MVLLQTLDEVSELVSQADYLGELFQAEGKLQVQML